MSSLLVNFRTTATITLINKSTGATTSINLSSRAGSATSGSGSSLSGIYHQIIKDVTEMGVALDRFAPTATTETLVLDDSMNSFGVERKFSDLLERYEIQNQAITITCSATGLENSFDVTGIEQVNVSTFTGYITKYSRPEGSEPVLNIEVEGRVFARKQLTRTPNDWISVNNTPAYNKFMPIILGSNQQVYPLFFYNGGTTFQYVYATHYGAFANNSGIQKYYLEDAEGEFKQVVSSSASGTAVFSQTGTVTTNAGDELQARDLAKTTSAQSYILTHAMVRWIGVSANFASAITFTYEIWSKDSVSGKPKELVGTAKYRNASQTWVAGTTYDIEAVFEKPVALTSNDGYFFLPYIEYETQPALPIQLAKAAGSGTTSYETPISQNKEGWESATRNLWIYSLYGAEITDSPTDTSSVDSQGRYLSYMTLTYKALSSAIDLSNLNFMVEANGLKDGISASITGVAGTILTRPDHIIKALSCKWNGSANVLDTTTWDIGANYSSTFNNYQSGSYQRTINGVLDGQVYLEDAVREICEQSATRCYLTNSGKLDLWAWGNRASSSATINQEQCQLGEFRTLDLSYVVNEANVGYSKTLEFFNTTRAVITDQKDDFTATLKVTNSDSKASVLLGQSVTLYGIRELKDVKFYLVNDSTSATNLIYHLFGMFAYPPKYVDIILPIHLTDNYISIQPLANIELIHPSLPSYFGTSYNAKLGYYDGATVDAGQGYQLTRASKIRLQIEDRFINFATGQTPTLRWTCRVLENAGDPT